MRKPLKIEGQLSVFDQPATVPTEYGGLAVNLADRAPHIITALGAISQLNQKGGLDFISEARIHPGRSQLWGRYQEMTPFVVDRALAKVDDLKKKVREEMWAAGHYDQTIAAGLMTRQEALAYHRYDLRKLADKYGGTGKVATKRNKLKRKLSGDLRRSESAAA